MVSGTSHDYIMLQSSAKNTDSETESEGQNLIAVSRTLNSSRAEQDVLGTYSQD